MANLIFHPVTYPNNNKNYVVASSYAKSLWGSVSSELKTFFTSSLQTGGSVSSSKSYYYEVWGSASLTCNDERMFSVAYGHEAGSGSAYLDPVDTTSGDTPSKSVFSQFKLMCLDGDEEGFLLSGSIFPFEHIYAISINRDKFGNRIDPGNFQLHLVGLSGSGVPNNVHTGSRVRVSGSNPKLISLIDDSGDANQRAVDSNPDFISRPRYIVSGSISNGISGSYPDNTYGILYPSLGVMILDADKLNDELGFNTVTGSNVAGDNAFKLFTSISGAAAIRNSGFIARSIDVKNESSYYINIMPSQFGYASNNPTYILPEESPDPDFPNDSKLRGTGIIKEEEWRSLGNPPRPPQASVVYITSIGLYNDTKDLIAVAKLNRPVKFEGTRDLLNIIVKLEY
jgi:hypothetical protein